MAILSLMLTLTNPAQPKALRHDPFSKRGL